MKLSDKQVSTLREAKLIRLLIETNCRLSVKENQRCPIYLKFKLKKKLENPECRLKKMSECK